MDCLAKVAEGCSVFIDMELDLLTLAEEAFNKSESEQDFINMYNRSLSLYYDAAYEACTDSTTCMLLFRNILMITLLVLFAVI